VADISRCNSFTATNRNPLQKNP